MANTTTVAISPEQARVWLDRYKADVQRPITAAKVRYYAEKMRQGEFGRNSTIHLRTLDGQTYFIDGRHRIKGIIESGTTQNFIVISDTVNSRTELIEEFRRINDAKVVSQLDYCVAAGVDTETGLSRKQISLLLGAATLLAEGFDQSAHGGSVDVRDKISVIREYQDAADEYFGAVQPAPKIIRNSFRWSATIAVGIVTFKDSVDLYGHDKVFSFWDGAARMVNEKTGDPRGTLVRFMLKTTPPTTNPQPGVDAKPINYIARYIASCFNAWVENRTISNARPKIDEPICIRGSRLK